MQATRRDFLAGLGAAGMVAMAPEDARAKGSAEPALVKQILEAFFAEALPDGGVDRKKSRWQSPGRGAAVGGTLYRGGIDPRYYRFAAEVLYRFADRPGGNARYRAVADGQVAFMARETAATHPMWAIGNALELIGVSSRYHGSLKDPAAACKRLVEAARKSSVQVTTLDGVTFRHFPCGYGVLQAKDAGWTNDLSMFGAGLIHAFEVTRDESILADAISFAEYFVQPWQPNALGKDGYWQCGTWHEQLGSWVIGPSHYTGFESTDAYGDEASWVFSTMTCIDFLTRLYRHKPDPRYLERSVRAADWTFRACQFDDGAVGMCGRDDKWLGFTADAVSQVAMLRPHLPATHPALPGLSRDARRARTYFDARMTTANLDDHGVEWVNRKTSTDPLVNVAMLWASTLLGWLNREEV